MKVKEIYDKFQHSLNEFAKRYKDEIKSDPKFRDKFSDMCQEFDVNPMLGTTNNTQLKRIFGQNSVLVIFIIN